MLPGAGIGFRIINGQFDLEISVVEVSNPLDGAAGGSEGIAPGENYTSIDRAHGGRDGFIALRSDSDSGVQFLGPPKPHDAKIPHVKIEPGGRNAEPVHPWPEFGQPESTTVVGGRVNREGILPANLDLNMRSGQWRTRLIENRP